MAAGEIDRVKSEVSLSLPFSLMEPANINHCRTNYANQIVCTRLVPLRVNAAKAQFEA